MPAEKIRIDDLAHPVLSDGQRAAIAYGEEAAAKLDLSVGSVLADAAERTGLDDFGDEDFQERLELWLSASRDDPERGGIGHMGIYNDCVRYAANRALIRDLLERHPEIHDQEIHRPIIVVGLPRSGTTHLVNLIAADERLRSMPLWEGQEPVPNPKEPKLDDKGVDPRYARSEFAWQMLSQNSPLLASMHPMSPDHIHEELELMCPDFSSYNLEWITRSERWRDYYLAHDQRPHYAYMKTALKILQWVRPRERWVLKCPQHLEQLGPLLDTFPDATIVVTHRDPVSVVQSAATMLCYGARMTYKNTRPEWYLEYWHDRVRRLLEASVRDRPLVPSDRSIDVLFHEFMADDVAMVEKIYEVADLEMTPEARAQIDQYMIRHPRGKSGQVVYDLRGDFGADPAELRDAYSFYLDRFPVRVEVK